MHYPENRGPAWLTLHFLIAMVLIALALHPTHSLWPEGNRKERIATLLKRGEAHFFKKRYYTAGRLFKEVIDLDPENRRAYAFLGDIYLITGKLDRAEDTIRIAIELNSNPYREYFRLGQLMYLKKKGEKALAAFEKAYRLNPSLHICRFHTGLVQYYLMRNKAKVISDWTIFRKLAPDDPQGPDIDRALAYLRRKDFKFPDNGSKSGPGRKGIPIYIYPGRGGSGGKSVNGGSGGGGGKTGPNGGGAKTGKGANARPQFYDPIILPPGTDTPIPDKQADPAKEKENNQTEDIIEIDDL